MKTKSIISLLLIIAVVGLISSCVKEGPRGPAGQNGVDGNANVLASPWLTPLAWQGDTFDWYFDVTSADITQDIIDYGAVLAYIKIPNDILTNSVRSIPAYVDNAEWNFFIPQLSTIEFTSNATARPGTTGYNFRFIIIPSNANVSLKSGTINGYKKSELQNMPYSDVCKLLGIKE